MSMLDFRVANSNLDEASCTNTWKWLYNLETTIYSNLQMWDNMVLWLVSETKIFLCFENKFVDIFLWLAFFYINESFFFPNFKRCPKSIVATVIYIITQLSNDKKPHRSYSYFLACRCLFEFILNLFIWCGTCWYFQVELDEPKLLNHFNYINK